MLKFQANKYVVDTLIILKYLMIICIAINFLVMFIIRTHI